MTEERWVFYRKSTFWSSKSSKNFRLRMFFQDFCVFFLVWFHFLPHSHPARPPPKKTSTGSPPQAENFEGFVTICGDFLKGIRRFRAPNPQNVCLRRASFSKVCYRFLEEVLFLEVLFLFRISFFIPPRLQDREKTLRPYLTDEMCERKAVNAEDDLCRDPELRSEPLLTYHNPPTRRRWASAR